MFRKYRLTTIDHISGAKTALSTESVQEAIKGMADAKVEEHETESGQKAVFYFINTIIDGGLLQQAIIKPLINCSEETVYLSLKSLVSNVLHVESFAEAKEQLMSGSVLIHDPLEQQWFAIPVENQLGRPIESSLTETVIYGPKDSFTEQIGINLSLIRRRLPLTNLKTESLTAGTLSKTSVMIVYIAGLTNREFVEDVKKRISEIDFDTVFDSAQLAELIEYHHYSIFPQFQQTERPDICVYNLSIGKITILVDNTPYALNAPITFFHLFHSPEDYTIRWPISSFLRCLRYFSFFLSIMLIPIYVALSTHHYHMIPLQILFVLIESRSKVPFNPFWEAVLMLIVIEIIKEASVRMPVKSSSTLGVISGIIIGEAAVRRFCQQSFNCSCRNLNGRFLFGAELHGGKRLYINALYHARVNGLPRLFRNDLRADRAVCPFEWTYLSETALFCAVFAFIFAGLARSVHPQSADLAEKAAGIFTSPS